MSEVNYYSGIKFTHHGMFLEGTRSIFYLPFGLTGITKRQIFLGVDVGPALIRKYDDSIIDDIFGNEDGASNKFGVFGSLKIGIRF